MNYYIDNIAYYLPNKLITNDYLVVECGLDKVFLEDKIGIKERRIADTESTSEMAYLACEKLLQNIDKNTIDVLLVCTQNPDFKLPTTACIVQNKLGLKTSCIAFDVNLGCSGFTYSLSIAGNFLKTDMANNVVIVMVDQYSKLIDYKDKNTASIFGDAASAILLKKCDDNVGVIAYDYGTDGSGAEHLMAYNSGVVEQTDKSNFLYMNGREIFKFSITTVPQSINNLLSKSGFNTKDIKYFIFHQANKYMLTEIKKKLDLTDEQMVIDMEKYGNTVSSTIPIAYKNLIEKKMLNKGDLVVFSGFGVGLSWGSILYKEL